MHNCGPNDHSSLQQNPANEDGEFHNKRSLVIRARRQNGPQTKERPQREGLHLSGPQTETGSEEDNAQKAGFGEKKRRTGAI